MCVEPQSILLPKGKSKATALEYKHKVFQIPACFLVRSRRIYLPISSISCDAWCNLHGFVDA